MTDERTFELEKARRELAKFLDVATHARGFHLEDAEGFTAAEEVIRFGVVGGQVEVVDSLVEMLFDEGDGAFEDGEVGEAAEVHFEQADLGDLIHGPVGHGDGVFFAADGPLERDVVGEGVAADDDGGGVGAGVSGDALELAGLVDEGACFVPSLKR